MHKINRILVGLDLTDMDDTLIAYSSFLTKQLPIDKVYFFHVADHLDLPDEIKAKYPDLVAPVDEGINEIIERAISKNYSCDVEYEISIREGNPVDRLLRWADIKEVDLVVVGKKTSLKGSGRFTGQLSKVGHCSIISVPENTLPKISNILVPVDFSSSSNLALSQARELASSTGAKLLLQHTYVVPTGYHKSGKSYNEFAKIMEKNCENSAQVFVNKAQLAPKDIQVLLSLDDDSNLADKIWNDAHDQQCDLIVISSKGRSGLANLFLGSIAEKVLDGGNDIPVWVVKDKYQNMGFFDALLKI